MSIFERLGIKRKNKIGFSCEKVFVINYFRGQEVKQYTNEYVLYSFQPGTYNVCCATFKNHPDGNDEGEINLRKVFTRILNYV